MTSAAESSRHVTVESVFITTTRQYQRSLGSTTLSLNPPQLYQAKPDLGMGQRGSYTSLFRHQDSSAT